MNFYWESTPHRSFGPVHRAADLAEAVFGPDPGLLRLQMAGRVLLACSISLIALLVLMDFGLMPIAGVAMGYMVSIFATLMVRDPSRRQQVLTILLLGLPALAAVTGAAALAPFPQWVSDIGFVILVVAATVARAAGPRGMAMGMTAYIAYFMGMILHPKLAQMPLLVLAVAIALSSAALARFVLMPERPGFTLRQAIRHIERRIVRILAATVHAVGVDREAAASAVHQDHLHRELSRLNDATLMAANQTGSGGDPSSDITGALFALELAVERVIRTAERVCVSAPEQEHLRRRAQALREGIGAGMAAAGIHLQRHGTAPPGSMDAALDALQAAMAGLAHAWRRDEATGEPGTGRQEAA